MAILTTTNQGLNFIGGTTFIQTGTTTVMSIQTNGNVGIGVTSNTTHKLIVSGGSNIASFRSEGSGQNLKKLSISTGGDRVVLDASTTADAVTNFAFQTGGTETMRIDSAGAIKFNAYNSGNNTGTPTYILGTDASGNVVKVLGGDIPGAPGGSGTLNTIPLWTPDGNTLGNSVLSQSGTSIYQGVAGTSASGYYYFNTTTTGDSGLLFADNTSTNSGFLTYNHDVDAMKFGTSNTERMRIDSSGNVGINETSPKAKLNITGVSGGPTVPVSASSGGIVRIESSNGGVGLDIGAQGASPYSMWMQVGNTSNSSGDTYPILLNPLGGNVGIGTTSPSDLLSLATTSGDCIIGLTGNSSGDPEIHMDSGNNRSGNIKYGDGSTLAMFRYDHSDVAFKFYAHNQTIVDFQVGENTSFFATSNVGIGTTSPGYKLDVVGSIKASVQGRFASGSAATPSYSFDADSDSGMFRATTNALGFSTAGTERMRINSSGNVGIGETNPAVPLHVSRDSASGENIALLLDNNNTTAGNEIGMLFRCMTGGANTDFEIFGKANAANDMDLVFQSDGSNERVRFTGDGNVGIGTASPVAALDITKVTPSVTTFFPYLQLSQRGTVANTKTGISFRNTEYDWDMGHIATERQGSSNSFDLVFYTANAGADGEGLRIDHLGNVGIGTTSPNQGGAASASTVVSTKASASGGVAITELIGLGNNDNDKVGVISFMSQNATSALADIRGLRHTSDTTGKLDFFTSGSQRMRIDSAGGVIFGSVAGAVGTSQITTAIPSSPVSSRFAFGTDGSGWQYRIAKNTAGTIVDLLTVKDNGNVGIGTINPGSKLQVAGEIRVADGSKATPSYSFTNDPDTGMFSDLANTLRFGTGANTRMTIEPSGEVGINTTGPSAALHLRALTTNGVPFKLEGDSNTTVEQMLIITSKAYNSTDAWYNLVAQAGDGSGGATNTCIIERDGDLRNKNNSYGQISDSRLKENITDATPKLDDVMKVKVKNFNFIGEDLKQIGVVAQELEEVFPGLVKEDKQPDVNGEEGGIYKSVKYSVLVPILLKAMQEQQDQIEDLKTRITQLEN